MSVTLTGEPLRLQADFEPQGDQPDFWRFARALYAAGFRAGIANPCS